MRNTQVLSISPRAIAWIGSSRHPRVLHVFEHSCNLVNERMEVLSIVSPDIGNGPFNLVVEDHVSFREFIQFESLVTISGDRLRIGELNLLINNATQWSPRPNWESLHADRANIAGKVCALPVPESQFPNTLTTSLSSAIAAANVPASKRIASRLAGLGAGLTPGGDDFLMGALYAGWIIHPHEAAESLAIEMANISAPLTTTLSAAWLTCAARGEAGEIWHDFFNALLFADLLKIKTAFDKILMLGATSGTEALAGFTVTFLAHAENERKHVLPQCIP